MGPRPHLRSWVFPGAPARPRMRRHDSRTHIRHRPRGARPAPRDRLRRQRHRHGRRREPARRSTAPRRPRSGNMDVQYAVTFDALRSGVPQDHRRRARRRVRLVRLVVLPEERDHQREPLRRLPRQRRLRRGRADVHQLGLHRRRQGEALPVLDQRRHGDHAARRHRAHAPAELLLDDHPQGARRAEPGRPLLRGQVRPRRRHRPGRRRSPARRPTRSWTATPASPTPASPSPAAT